MTMSTLPAARRSAMAVTSPSVRSRETASMCTGQSANRSRNVS